MILKLETLLRLDKEYLIVSEISFAKPDQKVKYGKLGLLLKPSIFGHLLDAIVYFFTFIVYSIFEINSIKKLFNFHKKLN